MNVSAEWKFKTLNPFRGAAKRYARASRQVGENTYLIVRNSDRHKEMVLPIRTHCRSKADRVAIEKCYSLSGAAKAVLSAATRFGAGLKLIWACGFLA